RCGYSAVLSNHAGTATGTGSWGADRGRGSAPCLARITSVRRSVQLVGAAGTEFGAKFCPGLCVDVDRDDLGATPEAASMSFPHDVVRTGAHRHAPASRPGHVRVRVGE